MADEIPLGAAKMLPAPPAGWFEYGYALLWNGDLAMVRCSRDIRAEYGRWQDEQQKGSVHAPPTPEGERLRLSTFDGSLEAGAIEVPSGRWPKVDRLADGRWLVASTQANPDNARLYAADGTPAGTFAIGDGILHIRCAPDGTIWVGYFDEGVYAGANEDGSWPISSSGVAHLGSDGSVLWRFNDESRAGLYVDDCYALALDGNTLWCCPYTDFPIVRVEDGAVRHWRNEVTGAAALAVDGEYVLLAGGSRSNAGRIALLQLGNDAADKIGEWQFRPPERGVARLLQGQGATLHMVGQGSWTKLSVSTLRAALKAASTG